MKRPLVAFALLLALSAHADEARVERTIPQGYAFDHPELLATQRVWGIAHGARLLAQACAQAGLGEAAEAWVTWLERELPQFLAMSRELAGHYFDEPDAAPARLAAMLGLPQALALTPEQIEPACATLAEALAQPRYDLAGRRAEMIAK